MFTLDDNSEVSWLLDNNNYTKRRQDFPEVFVRTGLLYLVSAKVLKERNTIYGDHIHTLIVDENRAFTIDEEADFLRAEHLMSNKAK
jgi:N-acylneuraminate cytidylyltransferase